MKTHLLRLFIGFMLTLAVNEGHSQCPPFTHQVITFEIDQFNFHRPKFDCEKGFSICIKGHWESKCVPNSPLYARITEKGIVEGYALLNDGKVEIHLPAALADLPEYSKEDMTIFSMERDWVEVYIESEKLGSLKEGEYKVKRTKTELIITVETE